VARDDTAALAVLRAALDEAPAERDALIDRRCAGDPVLAARVRTLLAGVDESSLPAPLPPGPPGELVPGELVADRYRLDAMLAAGGMGEVWSARRVDGQYRQQVAIKFMHAGSLLFGARFARERQILARLQHPNIAHLIDGGVTPGGRGWLAMEFVDGESITHWCDRHRLDVAARVRLFLPVCAAVQFAHRSLVVHRDIKPANILVGADGRPRLLDFGIARLLDDEAGQTQTMAMTPAYATPEQRQGDPVTTLSDVYQLGLVLFELLCGVSRHQARRDTGGGGDSTTTRPDQAYARIVQRDASRADAIAGLRRTSGPRLRGLLRGDLARIVDKALAPVPAERYGSAQDLAEDLARWCSDLPVRAHRGSLAYRAGKFMRRHRYAAAIAAVLAAGLAVASVLAWNTAAAERRQLARTENALAFMRDLFRANTPTSTDGATLTVEELLEGAAERIESRFADDPGARALLLAELGDMQRSQGLYQQAADVLQRSLAAVAPVRAQEPAVQQQAIDSLANTLLELYRYQDVLDLVDAHLAAGDADQPGHLLHLRGNALAGLGRLEEAERDMRAALALQASREDGAADLNTSTMHNDLGHVLNYAGRPHEALEQFEQAGRLLARSPDATRLTRLVNRTSTALVHLSLGQVGRAVALYEQALPDMEDLLGPGHNRTTIVRSQLAQARAANADYTGALALIDRNLELLRAAPDTADMDLVQVGQVVRPRLLLHSLRLDEALPLIRSGVDFLLERMPAATLERVVARWVLGETLLRAGEFDQADAVLRAALDDVRAIYGDKPNAREAELRDSLGRLALLRGDPATAQAALESAVASLVARVGEDSRSTHRSRIHLLWAQASVSRDPALLVAIGRHRDALVDLLGTDQAVPVWQTDLLLDRLARELGGSGPSAQRIGQARAGLTAAAGGRLPPLQAGLSGL
jgi:tetratricopeptide (TPR) repeat protein